MTQSDIFSIRALKGVGDKLIILSFLKCMPQFNPAEISIAEELIDQYLTLGEASGYHTYVAGRGTGVMGYICYGPTPLTRASWDIYWIAVNPASQGRGIGCQLMQFAEKAIFKQGGRIIMLETSSRPDYMVTRQFYRHLGYKIEAKISDFYSPGDHKLILVKRYAA